MFKVRARNLHFADRLEALQYSKKAQHQLSGLKDYDLGAPNGTPKSPFEAY
jgi:hypothetical protein